MQYNLKGTNLSITPEIRDHVEKRLNALDKFIFDKDATRADVELEFLKGEEKMYRAEIMVHDPKLPKPMRVEVRRAALHEALDVASGELTTELTRAKKKRLHFFRQGGAKVKDIMRGFRDRF